MTRQGVFWALALLLVPALLAGCMGEPIHVAFRVPAGRTVSLSGVQVVEGSLLVEAGGTLLLDGADLRIEQALILEGGTLQVTGSRIVFDGPYARHEAHLRGVATFVDTRISGLSRLEVGEGRADLRGGSLHADEVVVRAAQLHVSDVAWGLAGAARGTGGGPALQVLGGEVRVEGGSFEGGMGVHVAQGQATLRGASFALTDAPGAGFGVSGGRLALEGVVLSVVPLARSLVVDGGVARLVDTPLPREALPPQVFRDGRLEVGWTLTARVVGVPSNAPLAGANVTLVSANDPAAPAQATTDEKGEARLVALEYVLAAGGSRSGNPHLLAADADGRKGAAAGLVLEAPATVLVPVPGA